jgi:hypothetical protein
LWRRESGGLLSLALSAAALRLVGDPAAPDAASVLTRSVAATPDADTVALAWAAIATGTSIERLEVS